MFRNLTTAINNPKIFYEYALYKYQKLTSNNPKRLIRGVRIGSFVNFSEYHAVPDYVSDREARFIAQYPFDGDGAFVDIGANLGLVSLLFARRFPQRRIVAFEPGPSTFAALTANVAGNAANVECHQVALSERDGEVRFAFKAKARANSAITDGAEGVLVPSRRLDSVVRELGIDRIAFLKIDTEGFETAVLRGATDVLGRVRPSVIYFEIVPALARRAGFSPTEAASILTRADYDLFEIGPDTSLVPVPAAIAERQTLANWVALPRTS